MEPALLGLILDSSVIIEAEREGQTVEHFWNRSAGASAKWRSRCSVTVAELVHGVYRANTGESRQRAASLYRRAEATCPGASGDG